MHYLTLGRSGLRVSELALGTMRWDGASPTPETRRVFEVFAEAGGNFLDTADAYGTEPVVGELLGAERDQFVLGTKYTLETRRGDVNAAGNQRKHVIQALEASLRRLRTDYVDVYWVHARDTLTPVEEVMRALDDLVRAGKVLYLGVSDWPAWEIAKANTIADLRGWTSFVGLQVPYSLLERSIERELQPMALGLDLGLTAWAPLGGGLLTGKPIPADEAGQRTTIVREVIAVAADIGATPGQVAFAWLRQRPGTVIPIVGASNEQQMVQNLGCLDISLTPDQVRRLDDVSAISLGFPYEFLQTDGVLDVVYGQRRDEIRDGLGRGRRMADRPDQAEVQST